MATVRDKKTIDHCLVEDNQTFVFNWLSTPFQKKRDTKDMDISARLEDILDELQDVKGPAALKVRIK